MGLCAATRELTDDDKRARDRNKNLDSDLLAAKQVEEKIHKVLLLGAGDSGKSTVFKQIMHNYGKKYTQKDMLSFKPIILDNINNSVKMLCKQSKLCGGYECMSPEVQQLVTLLEGIAEERSLTPERASQIATFWADEGTKHTFANRNMYQMQDSVKYFFDKVEQVYTPEFVPSFDDILRCRAPTTGIVETDFEFENAKFKMFDVGGQRSERKKWIHCFENVTAVVFVASISEFDQSLYEDNDMNRMDEALNLFEEICNLEWFNSTSMILFLNKSDLLREKLENGTKFGYFFKETDTHVGYAHDDDFIKEDGSLDVDAYYSDVSDFLQEEFLAKNHLEDKKVYPHITCATDTEQIKHVFKAVKDTIINEILKATGLL